MSDQTQPPAPSSNLTYIPPIPAQDKPKDSSVTQTTTETVKTSVEPKKGVQTVHIDGALYVAIGFLTAVYTSLSSDDAAKFASPDVLFWSKLAVGGLNAGFLSLKMFRSTSFAESKQ